MMYPELYRYLIHHNQLHIPGIGTFLLERKPARTNFPNRSIDPPIYNISLEPGGQNSRGFFSWLAERWQVNDKEAIVRFNDFVFGLRQQLNKGNEINWKGIGKLTKGLGGEIRLDKSPAGEVNAPVRAEKLIREHAEHVMRVGEEEKTSSQMVELLGQAEETKKSYWWTWPLMVGILLLMIIGLYFSIYGIDPSSTANRTHIKSEKPVSNYKNLP